MRTIRIKFVDVWQRFVPEDNICYRLLARHYAVRLSDDPEYVFSLCMGLHHVDYESCVKIQLIGENMVPDFNWFDYAIGFDHLDFGDRFVRFPLFAMYDCYQKLALPRAFDPSYLLGRDFCSIVISGSSRDPIVFEFARRLSKYKNVASGGRIGNTVGGPVADKLAFCSRYKFNIAFENSSIPGYTTEKVMEPLTVGSVPVYWGDPRICDEFTPGCMVRVRDRAALDAAVDEIVELDRDDAAYVAKCNAPCLVLPHDSYERRLEDFLVRIVEQPADLAKRRAAFGFQPFQRQRFRGIYASYQRRYDLKRKLKTILHLG